MLTDALAQCLRAHTAWEERLLDAVLCHRYEPLPAPLKKLHDDDENHRTRLAILHELITNGSLAGREELMAQAESLITALRHHMAKEGEEFFPFPDQEFQETGQVMAAAIVEESPFPSSPVSACS